MARINFDWNYFSWSQPVRAIEVLLYVVFSIYKAIFSFLVVMLMIESFRAKYGWGIPEFFGSKTGISLSKQSQRSNSLGLF